MKVLRTEIKLVITHRAMRMRKIDAALFVLMDLIKGRLTSAFFYSENWLTIDIRSIGHELRHKRYVYVLAVERGIGTNKYPASIDSFNLPDRFFLMPHQP